MFLPLSMGGSVAVHVAAKKALSSLAGLVVVDVVEVLVTHDLFQPDCMVLLVKIILTITNTSGNCNGFVDSYAENPIKQDATFSKH